MNPDNLRAQMSLVSQEPVLFDGTISDNIRYGRLDATQVPGPLKMARRQHISAGDQCRRPEGGGLGFYQQAADGDADSGGGQGATALWGTETAGGYCQSRHTVVVSRGIVYRQFRRPTVLLFDEATSALDSKHEDEVCHAIDLASEGLTTITIAHRLSTVKSSDRIIVIENGQIVEQGPPEELLATEGGKFKKVGPFELISLFAALNFQFWTFGGVFYIKM